MLICICIAKEGHSARETRLQVLKADKRARAGPQLCLLGRQVLLFRGQSRIVLLIKEKKRMVHGLVGRVGSRE